MRAATPVRATPAARAPVPTSTPPTAAATATQRPAAAPGAIPAPTLPVVRTPGKPPAPETRLQRLARKRGVQMALFVSTPGDAREKEADEATRRVLTMGAPRAPVVSKGAAAPVGAGAPAITERTLRGGLYRKAAATLPARRAPSMAAPSLAAPSLATPRASAPSAGQPLSTSLRGFMEPRFGADFSAVRVHTGSRAENMNQQVGARAFTLGSDIYFGRGQYAPESTAGRGLIAHELTHTIQQGATSQTLARAATNAPVVGERSPVGVQRLGIGDALDYFADAAYNIPGYRMFTILLGVNPINMSSVDRSAANILRALIEFIPGGNLITRALDSYGIIDKVATWVQQQIETLGITGSLIKNAISRFLDSLSWSDIFDLGGVWERAKSIFTEPIGRIIDFAVGLAVGILGFIKDAILMPLARLAEGTDGYPLLKAVLGVDPISGEAVPRTADTLIGGFMQLIGQQEIWENIKKANAIARAWAWFQGALQGLIGLVSSIPDRFMALLQSLTIEDVVLIAGAFKKVASAFAGFVGDFISWAGGTVLSLLQIIFEVVAPNAVPYIAKAAGAFRTIIQNPIGFVGNLVKAGMMGLRQFMSNFLAHLKAALINWLTGSLAGSNVYIPQAFSLLEILKFVLSVLGLTWTNIRQKLVKAIGEPAVKVLETTFDLVLTLVREGPAAAWQKIVEGVGDLKAMAISAVMDYVKEKIVTAAITRLVSMLSPAGAFIQAIIAIYNTIMFFIERLRTIMQVAMSFVDSIAAIAAGTLGAAANRVEKTMAGLLVLVISFLARIAGLGKVSDAVKKLIDKIRSPIDKALDKVITWLVNQAKKLGKLAAQAGVPQDPNERLRLGVDAATKAVDAIRGTAIPASVIQPLMGAIKVRYGLKSIGPVEKDGDWWIEAEINPKTRKRTRKKSGAAPAGAAGAAAPAGPTLAGNVLTVSGKTFNVGDQVQVARGRGWIQEPHFIISFSKQTFGGTELIMVELNTRPATTRATVSANTYPTQWRAPIASMQPMSQTEFDKIKDLSSWDDFETAKKVLNWRASGIQTAVPGGKSWEHIVEQSSGFGGKQLNSVSNLALVSRAVNTRLGTFFGTARKYHELMLEDITEPVILRDYLNGKSFAVHRTWKMRIYALPEFGLSLGTQDQGRGPYQVLG